MIHASIVTYKTHPDELSSVLRCAVESTVEKIYIVDNSPSEELRSFADFSPQIDYIGGHGNIGYGAAHNIAIRKAISDGAEYHIVLNPDIEFQPDDIQRMTDYMDSHSEVGWVMPRVIYPDGEMQYLCKLLPAPMDLIGRRFLGFLPSTRKRDQRFEMRVSGYDREMDPPFCSGCFMFLRTDTLRDVGLFDDRIFMYGEDLDLSRRIYTSERWTTRFWPEVTIVHAHNKESYRSRKLLWIHMKSIVYYFNKYGWLFDNERKKVNAAVEAQYLNL